MKEPVVQCSIILEIYFITWKSSTGNVKFYWNKNNFPTVFSYFYSWAIVTITADDNDDWAM